MQTLTINTKNINNELDFHEEFKNVLGFFDGYGKNMDAWIDCMSDIMEDTSKSLVKKVSWKNNEILCIEIRDTEDFNKRCPELMSALIECTAFVNQRYMKFGHGNSLCLKFL